MGKYHLSSAGSPKIPDPSVVKYAVPGQFTPSQDGRPSVFSFDDKQFQVNPHMFLAQMIIPPLSVAKYAVPGQPIPSPDRPPSVPGSDDKTPITLDPSVVKYAVPEDGQPSVPGSDDKTPITLDPSVVKYAVPGQPIPSPDGPPSVPSKIKNPFNNFIDFIKDLFKKLFF